VSNHLAVAAHGASAAIETVQTEKDERITALCVFGHFIERGG
jgi:hypothetical protein